MPNYDFHSCANCQYLFPTYEGGTVCNAFHILEGLDYTQLEQNNTCPDFEETHNYNRWITCQCPTKDQLEALSDSQVNEFNSFVGVYLSTESIEEESNVAKTITITANNPILLLRPNGNCPIRIIDIFTRESKWIILTGLSSTQYFDGSPNILTIKADLIDDNRIFEMDIQRPSGKTFSMVKGRNNMSRATSRIAL